MTTKAVDGNNVPWASRANTASATLRNRVALGDGVLVATCWVFISPGEREREREREQRGLSNETCEEVSRNAG